MMTNRRFAYKGFWSGYQILVDTPVGTVALETEEGVRGINVQVETEVTEEGGWSAYLDGRKLNLLSWRKV